MNDFGHAHSTVVKFSTFAIYSDALPTLRVTQLMSDTVILVVEDNPKNLKLIRDLLQVSGYVTLEAGDGESALEIARRAQPALILMDVQLPVMDGLTAMKALKKDECTRHIPIIALTALAMKGDKQSFLKEGFDDYISKPIDIEQLFEVLGRYVSSEE